ncbi:MAG: GNAT family N-acetyltransferase [Clostridia bacterium]|nr:GNAT family N-acetyltransferase [Clostridia bacterium]MDE7208670.1 GNAT family N-acetyltransferase [Clostridia bacterium]
MIRKYKKEDRETTLAMMKEFYSSPAVLHKICEDNFLRTLDEAESDSPYMDIFILGSQNQVAGYALTAYTYSNEAGGKVVWIEELFVLPSFQGQGLGKEFLIYIKSAFGDFARIRLEVEESNDGATRLYRREGFESLNYRQFIIDKS